MPEALLTFALYEQWLALAGTYHSALYSQLYAVVTNLIRLLAIACKTPEQFIGAVKHLLAQLPTPNADLVRELFLLCHQLNIEEVCLMRACYQQRLSTLTCTTCTLAFNRAI
jgi:hypothetical protein